MEFPSVPNDLVVALAELADEFTNSTGTYLNVIDQEHGLAVFAAVRFGEIDSWSIQTWTFGIGMKAEQLVKRNNENVRLYKWADKELVPVLIPKRKSSHASAYAV